MRFPQSVLIPLTLVVCTPLFAQAPPTTQQSQASAGLPAAPALTAKARVRRVAMIEIPGRPGFQGVVATGGFLVMAHPAASTVDVFNVKLRRLVAQVKDMNGASGVAVDERAGRVFVANSGADDIAVLSTRNWSLERSIPLQVSPNSLLFVPELNALYVGNRRDQSISIIDPNQGSATRTVGVEGQPEYLVFDPVTRQIYVSLEDTREVVVRDPGLKLIKRFPLVASEPTGLALDAKARRLYVAVRHAVLALNADTGQELRRVAAPVGIDMLWLDEGSNSLYGGSADGTVTLMRTGGAHTLLAEQEFKTDVHGHTLAFDPVNKLIYVPGGREGRSKLLILRQVDFNQAATPQLAAK